MPANNVLKFPEPVKKVKQEPVNNISAKMITGHTLQIVDGYMLVLHDPEGNKLGERVLVGFELSLIQHLAITNSMLEGAIDIVNQM